MPIVRIPTPLRTYTEGQNEVAVEGSNVAEAMNDLVARYPSLKAHLFSGEGRLRPFVNLFLDEENIRDLQGVETSLKEDDRLLLVPSVAGGA